MYESVYIVDSLLPPKTSTTSDLHMYPHNLTDSSFPGFGGVCGAYSTWDLFAAEFLLFRKRVANIASGVAKHLEF
jgi:hypothetical protein